VCPQQHEELAAEAEYQVPGLVDREVEAVEPTVGIETGDTANRRSPGSK
jgi:hypothetical protein